MELGHQRHGKRDAQLERSQPQAHDNRNREGGPRAILAPVTGGEIIAIGKAVETIGKKVLAEDEKTKDILLRVAEGTPEMTAAAR